MDWYPFCPACFCLCLIHKAETSKGLPPQRELSCAVTRMTENTPPHPHGRGGSVSRRDHSQAYRRPPPPHRRNQINRIVQAKRQPLFGRGGLGERRFSQRSGLSPRISRTLPRSHLTLTSPDTVFAWSWSWLAGPASGTRLVTSPEMLLISA
jgi:hypothetical protein